MTVPGLAQEPQPGPAVMQEPVMAPEPPTESSFMESSIDADPVDAPVTQPPPTFEDKKGKKITTRIPKFKKRSEPKELTEKESMDFKDPKPLRVKPVTVPAFRVKEMKGKEEMTEARLEEIAMDTFQVLILIWTLSRIELNP